jgi:alpha-2-macroglobulin
LAMAKAADVNVRDDVLNRGYEYLHRQMKDEDNLHLLTYMAYALSQRGTLPGDAQKIVAGRLYEQRSRLTPYSQALLALALWNTREAEKARVLVRNLENTVTIDEANATARWKTQDRFWWNWWNNDVETNAVVLRAFLTIDAPNRLVPMITKWLTIQARGNHWRSTKETAEAVLSLAQYVRQNRELDVDYTLTVNLNNKVQRTYRVNRDNVLLFDNRFIVGDLLLQDGNNSVTIQKSGRGNLYWGAYSEYFSLEEPIKASGNEIAIARRYFKLTRKAAVEPEKDDDVSTHNASARRIRPILPRPIPQSQEPEYNRNEIRDGDELQSGDLVEVELTLDAKNDYEYLVFEDMKAAGLEPVDLRSGYAWGDGLSSNVELRDEKVALFVDRLPQGTRVLRYRMRAEIPGRFHALPTNGYAMYAPEVRAISDEMRLNVRD